MSQSTRTCCPWRWVSVAADLPSDYVDVAVYSAVSVRDVGLAYLAEDDWWWSDGGGMASGITHWMALPPEPCGGCDASK